MLKTSAFRSILATLCGLFLVSFLVACGGGGGDEEVATDNRVVPAVVNDQTIPAGAQVCELKDYRPPLHPVQDPLNRIRSDDDGLVLEVALSDDGTKYAISNWQSFYTTVSTWENNKPSGVVNERITVPVEKRSLIYYSNYLGTLNGRHVRGEDGWDNLIIVGTGSSGSEDWVSPEEVGGIEAPSHGGTWPHSPHVMSEPRLTQLDKHLFEVKEGRLQEAEWARIPNATVQFEVITDAESGSISGYRHCEILGLTGPTNVVAITGGRPGESYWVRVVTFARLDEGIQAYSRSEGTLFQY